MITLSMLAEIIHPFNLILSEDWREQKVSGISTDTRTLKSGEVFVALRGENFDGHDFLESALSAQASAVIVNRDFTGNLPSSVAQFYVENTLTAYQQIAHWWRQQHQIPVIGITGSVGKTTTKELIASVLSEYGRVLKTEGNENNEIGVPKTLLRLTSDHDYAVVEMAMRARGEIAQLTDIVQPSIGLITNVGTAHIGRLGSREAIAQAKCELLAQMPKQSLAILNQDNERLIKTAATLWQGKTLTYGLTGGDLQGQVSGEMLTVGEFNFPLPLPGVHNASNYLAALAVAQALNLDLTPFQKGITVQLPGARSRRYSLANDIVFLDETYNAGVESMIASLKLLKETPGDRHLAVLGTMKELGDQSLALHRQVGETVAQLNLDYLLVLADEPETEEMARAASSIPSECFDNQAEVIQHLKTLIQSGDRVLFKASHAVGLGEVLDQLRTLMSS